MKRFGHKFALSLAATLCLGLGLQGAAQAQDQAKGKRIAYLTSSTSNPFIAKLATTVQEEATARGMTVNLLTTPYDAALQSQQVSDVIAQGYDALLITPVAERGIIPALTAAKNAKLPVFVVNSPVADGNEQLYTSFIGEDNAELGRVAGEAIAEALKDRKNPKIALVTGLLAEGVAPRRLEGFKAAIAKHPGIKIVATEDAKWDTGTAERISGQLFARFAAQGGLDGVYGMADNVAHGVILAAKAAGVPLGTGQGQTVVVSSNCMKFGVDHIRQGEQYSTATQLPVRTGKETVAAVADYFAGKPVPKNNHLEISVITKANLDKFVDACSY